MEKIVCKKMQPFVRIGVFIHERMRSFTQNTNHTSYIMKKTFILALCAALPLMAQEAPHQPP